MSLFESKTDNNLEAMRHSASHVMAQAVSELFQLTGEEVALVVAVIRTVSAAFIST